MASVYKRSWKLQEFVAHNANVNCLALGHKSGRVMVTGGDDNKVNLWAIGKQSCFMSLSGHTTPVECVQFNYVEELVCAGSRSGALKVWDLEAAKLVRTLTGHKDSIQCVDFHPYGDFLTSGSADCSIKLWDSRKKGCIGSFPSHKAKVNSVKFSPDGQWIASGGDDSSIKIWDLRVGKVLKDFTDHANSVLSVEFHPHEFLLASGSSDRSVHFYDLENFNLVSSEKDLGSVRCLWFNPDGDCLFAGVRDYLKVVGWEPERLFDSVPVNWGRIFDISTAQHQLVGASFHLTNVMVYVVDLKRVEPIRAPGLDSSNPFSHNNSLRKSFSKAERPVSLRSKNAIDVKTIEENTSGTDPEEESTLDITNFKDYNEIFKARQSLRRTPPPIEPFKEPEEEHYADPTEPQVLGEVISDKIEALSLDTIHNSTPASHVSSTSYSRSKSNLDYIFRKKQQATKPTESEPPVVVVPSQTKPKPLVPVPPPKFALNRQNSCKDVPEKLPKNDIKHSVSEANLQTKNLLVSSSRNASRKNSFSKPIRNFTSTPNIPVSKIPGSAKITERAAVVKPVPNVTVGAPVDIFVTPVSRKISKDRQESDYVPATVDRPVGLDLDDFLPKNHQPYGKEAQLPDMSEAEVLGIVMRGHEPMMAVLTTRQKNLKVVLAQLKSKDLKAAMEMAIQLDDLAIIVDLLGIFNNKYSMWNLDLCVLLLPKVEDLLRSKFEMYMTTACNTLKLVLRHFGSIIKSTMQSPAGSFGVDLSREERYKKCINCYDSLVNIRPVLLKKQTLPGKLGNQCKEIETLMQDVLD
ncbi:katanin p80 WD40 repeat-containing subunit B1 [Agrilus planipennis]|uniref:Katanin p80 WD40 repeat-containing subunit B1 n=1 Tax=Agrilus planipennis TaxID=224129 RepID=A0A1W4WSN4_AGRPL|nr:katanin p80 WD40 repeat-containing subunit B1 [Agrilus planipennis]